MNDNLSIEEKDKQIHEIIDSIFNKFSEMQYLIVKYVPEKYVTEFEQKKLDLLIDTVGFQIECLQKMHKRLLEYKNEKANSEVGNC